MKIRHVLLAVAALLAIAFMQPLVTFLGGLTVLLGVGALIYRDLSPASQDAVERHLLGWLRRARPEHPRPTLDGQFSPRHSIGPARSALEAPVEPPRRARGKLSAGRPATAGEPLASRSPDGSEPLQ